MEEVRNAWGFFTCTLSTLRASPTTLSPFLVSSAAMAAPMPLLAPVTTATRPDQRSISQRSSEKRVGLWTCINFKTVSVHSSLYFWCWVVRSTSWVPRTLTVMLKKELPAKSTKTLPQSSLQWRNWHIHALFMHFVYILHKCMYTVSLNTAATILSYWLILRCLMTLYQLWKLYMLLWSENRNMNVR